MIEYFTINQVKAKNRLETAKRIATIAELFFELGYRTKKDIETQLIKYFPKYNDDSFKKQFGHVWNLRKLDMKVVEDLETVIDKINAL